MATLTPTRDNPLDRFLEFVLGEGWRHMLEPTKSYFALMMECNRSVKSAD